MPGNATPRPLSALSAKEKLYATVYDQAFSACGKYLAVCNNYGHIIIFSLSSALSSHAKLDEAKRSFFAFQASDKAIFSLITSDGLLLAGSCGIIQAWTWSSVIKKEPTLTWSLSLPSSYCGIAEVNSLVVNANTDKIYAGCGDNLVHVWDLGAGVHQGAFRGHDDYVHCVRLRNDDRECLSASEDGTVRLWDTRSCGREPVHVLEPHKDERLARPQVGKWVGCVATDGDWLACGGGPALALWHLRSLTPVVILEEALNWCQNTTIFHQDTLISGGTGGCVQHWYINGDLKSSVPSSASVIYSIVVNEHLESCKVLAASGSSAKVDVCTNFGYRAFSFDI